MGLLVIIHKERIKPLAKFHIIFELAFLDECYTFLKLINQTNILFQLSILQLFVLTMITLMHSDNSFSNFQIYFPYYFHFIVDQAQIILIGIFWEVI